MPTLWVRFGRALGILPLLGPALIWAAVVEVGLRRTTAAKVARRLGVPIDLSPVTGDTRPALLQEIGTGAQRRLRAARVLYRHWPAARERSCLRFALVAGRLLRKQAVAIRLGAKREEDGRIAAHAWLVLDGRFDLESDAFLYAPLQAQGVAP